MWMEVAWSNPPMSAGSFPIEPPNGVAYLTPIIEKQLTSKSLICQMAAIYPLQPACLHPLLPGVLRTLWDAGYQDWTFTSQHREVA
jgi:hypothetical protein